jgi:hypothetical protein
VEGILQARARARDGAPERPALSKYETGSPPGKPLSPLDTGSAPPLPASPDREELNRIWDLAGAETSGGFLSRLFSPLRRPLARILRFALGPFTERQTRMNSAQVRFDNELVRYLDARLDRMTTHYDRVLGLHGRRMEEIDERHLILQQELIRHVHDLVARIEFVFEAAEQNHLYLEGMLRESREELRSLAERLEALAKERR